MVSVKDCRAKNPHTCRVHGSEQFSLDQVFSGLSPVTAVASADREDLYRALMGSFTPEFSDINLIKDAASQVLEDYGDYEIVNHSAYSSADYLLLQDMADGSLADNNCFAATSEILERTNAQVDWDCDSIKQIELSVGGNYHTAILCSKDGEQYVVDFTARQFDPELEFPYVVSSEEWNTRMEEYLSS